MSQKYQIVLKLGLEFHGYIIFIFLPVVSNYVAIMTRLHSFILQLTFCFVLSFVFLRFFMSLNFSNCLIVSKNLEPLCTWIANGNFYCMTGCLLGHIWFYPFLHFTPSALSISPISCPYSNVILSSFFVTAH